MLILLLIITWLGLTRAQRRFSPGTILSHGASFEGQARIICSDDSIGIEISNAEGKDGRVYARRMSAEPNCVRHYAVTDKTVRLDVQFNFLPCGIKSRRMTHPRPGLEYSLSVVLSYGHTQMTEDDQMFSLACRYYANRRELGTIMEVSTFAKSYLVGGRNGPACEYNLHYNSLNGPTAVNAKIGDKVYHSWRCADSSFALKVYDCYVHDGSNNRKYKLIDEEGCSKDKTIIPDLTYDPALNFAFAPSRVFKFAESTKMYFNCLLYMCPKSDPACRQAIPPKCDKRRRRSIGNVLNLYSVNTSLPFSSHSSKSLEKSRESSSDEMGQLLLAAAEAEVANEKLDHILLSTTTVLPLVANDAESKQTAVISAPFIEFQPITTTLSGCSIQVRNSVKTILVGLIVCNLILLLVSIISIGALCRRHHSAQMELSRSYSAT